jgi:hypothetical protein
MKFRTSFQIPRPATQDGAKDGARPGTSRHFKIPSLLSRPSRSDLTNGASQRKAEESTVSLPNGTSQQKVDVSNGNLPNGTSRHKVTASDGGLLNGTSPQKAVATKKGLLNGSNVRKGASKTTPSRKAMQEFLQKTGANLKATGAKLEIRIPRRKSKVVCIFARHDKLLQLILVIGQAVLQTK